MKPNFNEIHPLAVARKDYEDHGLNLMDLHDTHLENGFVISVPYLYAMGYFFKEDDKLICHVTYAAGEIGILLRIGLNYALDFVEFENSFNGKIKRYPFKKIFRRLG